MNFRFSATNQLGKLIVHDKEKFAAYLLSLPEEVDVYVSKKKSRTRSGQQNKYLWGVVYQTLSDHTGYTPNEIHEVMACKFLKCWEIMGSEEKETEVERIKSTTELSTIEFEDYCSNIRAWASQELGVLILLPNEVEH